MAENVMGSWLRNFGERYLWPQLMSGPKMPNFMPEPQRKRFILEGAKKTAGGVDHPPRRGEAKIPA